MRCVSAFCAERTSPSAVLGAYAFAPFSQMASAGHFRGNGRTRRGACDGDEEFLAG